MQSIPPFIRTLCFLGLLTFGLSPLTTAQPTVLLRYDDTPNTHFLGELVQTELNLLAQGRFAIQYQEESWPATGSQPHDLLISLGPQSSQALIGAGSYPAPTIIGTVLDPQVQGLPQGVAGGSGIENLNYLRTPLDVSADLQYFRQIIDFQTLAVLVDDGLAQLAGGIQANLAGLVQAGETLSLVPLKNQSPLDVLAALPAGCDAVYLLPLAAYHQGESLTALLDTLSGAGLPTFAMLGSDWAEAGALASRAPAQSAQTLARRIALNALAILEGQPAASLPTVTTAVGDDFVLNLRAVRRSGVYPSWQLLGEARLLNLDITPEGPPVHLRGVIGEALAQNLAYQVSQRETEAGQQEVRLALAEMLPELTVGSTFSGIDQARSAASFGSTQPYTWAASAELSQVLFAEPLYANLRIQKFLQASRVASQNQTELDVVLEASEAYFNVLLAGSVVRLQNKNVDNTRINYNLARDKESVGYSGVSEVYRWESQLALNKIDLNEAQAQLQSAAFASTRSSTGPKMSPLRWLAARWATASSPSWTSGCLPT
jgi:outer membrane protein